MIPALTALGAIIFGYKAFKSGKSGSVQQDRYKGNQEVSGNTTNIGYTVFAVALAIATIVIIIMMNSDK